MLVRRVDPRLPRVRQPRACSPQRALRCVSYGVILSILPGVVSRRPVLSGLATRVRERSCPHAAARRSPHPKGTQARVLLTSVFGPYAQDDEYGSRAINPMELYHNQVTRAQGPFSLRMFHRSWGIMMIQAQHRRALHGAGLPHAASASSRSCARTSYDVVGITLDHRQRRARCGRCAGWSASCSPQATIVVGGHVANDPRPRAADRRRPHRAGRRRRLVPRASWARTRRAHPASGDPFGLRRRVMGVQAPERRRRHGRHDHPVGRLPDGLQLLLDLGHVRRQGQVRQLLSRPATSCSTSCAQSKRELDVQSFFVMDENFLLHRSGPWSCSN